MIAAIIILTLLDIIGYIAKCEFSDKFSKYTWRHIPFIWVVYAN